MTMRQNEEILILLQGFGVASWAAPVCLGCGWVAAYLCVYVLSEREWNCHTQYNFISLVMCDYLRHLRLPPVQVVQHSLAQSSSPLNPKRLYYRFLRAIISYYLRNYYTSPADDLSITSTTTVHGRMKRTSVGINVT